MYFNSTISDSTKLLKPVLVFAFAIAAALTGLTQITQHRSHPIDVYVGFLIGGFIAAYLVSGVTRSGLILLLLSRCPAVAMETYVLFVMTTVSQSGHRQETSAGQFETEVFLS